MRALGAFSFMAAAFTGCGADTAAAPGPSESGSGGSSADVGGTFMPGTASGGAESTGSPDTSGAPETGNGEGPKYDVGGAGGVDTGRCADRPAGIFCDDRYAVDCDGNGKVLSVEFCTELCEPATGCLTCIEGQYTCSGPRVLACDTTVTPSVWSEIDVCNPAAGEACNGADGTCEPAQIVGSNVPTGRYFQYAYFTGVEGYDVDGFDDLLYVTQTNNADTVDVYRVTIADTDGDGQIEPNQHPDNPDATGPIEARTLAFVESLSGMTTVPCASEIFAAVDRIYVGGADIREYEFGMAGQLVTASPDWLGGFSQVGFDEARSTWYASNEGARKVFQYDAETAQWGIAFRFPVLAGVHMDGLEVVADPNTGASYVYVSDMTSNFLGQYRLDLDKGWVQQNLFVYDGEESTPVEGMGFGPLNHFWSTSGGTLYEIGGGDLQEYTESMTPEG